MRQAVVIIHGIGEQRPMDTLRAFVAGALGLASLSSSRGVFSKPDRISDTLELRRLHVPAGEYGDRFVLEEGSETDFYELYWQHLMKGTRWGHVWWWAIPLLVSRKLTPRLEAIRWKAIAAAALAALAAVGLAVAARAWALLAVPAVLAAGALIRRFAPMVVDYFGLRYVGDAARYLSPHPENVEARRAIRNAGLTLLRGLHDDPLRRYARIVVVGHSLGSVIAYDVLTWLWQELHHLVVVAAPEPKTVATTPVVGEPASPHEDPLARLGFPAASDDGSFARRQRELWERLTSEGLPWRITDLVTLGSPLAHADVLLADGAAAFALAVEQRELPQCPPTADDDRDRKLLVRTVATPEGEREIRILHHGALFAVTRWTNLYYPGDFVGGPLRGLFGDGVKDVPLRSDRGERMDRSWRSHTRYWSADEKTACRALRAALDLNDEGGRAAARAAAEA